MRLSSITATLLALTGIAANQASESIELGRFDETITILANLDFTDPSHKPNANDIVTNCDEDGDNGLSVGELNRCADNATLPANVTATQLKTV